MTYTHGDRTQLRPATSADGPEVAALFIASRHDALPYLPELHSDESTTQWITETVLRHSTVWVAELDGIIVGFFSLVGDHLDHLYVRPGHYRQGVGDRLLARAKAMSPGKLRLFTFQRNARARAFYEARAFVVIACSDGSTNEEHEPDVLYEWIAPSTAAPGPDPSAGRSAGDGGRVRVGIVGAGFIGPTHIEAMRRLGFVDVVALAGGTQSSAERKAEALFVPRAYGDYRDLIADPGVDVVHIAAPNALHYAAARAALAAGKHVVCEKPLALTSVESAELVRFAEESGRVNAVTFNYRFYPLIRHVRALIQRGDLGQIYLVHGGYWQDWLLLATDYNWRVDSARGGPLRAVGDIGLHWLDLAEFLTGLSISAVFADLTTFLQVRQRPAQPLDAFAAPAGERGVPVPVETEDAGIVMLRVGTTGRGVMMVSQVSAGRKNRLAIEVNGASGSIAWDGERPNELWIGHRDRPNEVLMKDPALLSEEARPYARYPGGHAEGFPDSHTAANRAIYEYIRGGGRQSSRHPDFPTFADGHRAQILADCILESARNGGWVTVPS